MVSFRDESFRLLTFEARERGITIQELIRAVIVPEWMRTANIPQIRREANPSQPDSTALGQSDMLLLGRSRP